MARVLGVACAKSDAYLAVLESDADQVSAVGPGRVSVVAASDPGDALRRTLAEWNRVLAEVRPDVVALLLPENSSRTRQPHSYWTDRCEAETLVLLAAGLAGIPSEKMARATVRTGLGLGPLDEAAKAEPKQGMYWEHRALAFFAARTVVVKSAAHGWPEALKPGVLRRDEGRDGVTR